MWSWASCRIPSYGPTEAIYVACDESGFHQTIYANRDDGATWFDTGGRTGGRHTTFAVTSGNRILGMGGKNSDLNGYMPKSISADGGKSWEVSGTPFAPLATNQRPTLVRLASGRLFFAGDFQKTFVKGAGAKPEGITESGAYVALSEDDGETWHVKPLAGAVRNWREGATEAASLGYTVAKQGPNGIVHLITSLNQPALHFEMNEAWILSDAGFVNGPPPDNAKPAKYEEHYESGALKVWWEAIVDTAHGYLLHGKEMWYYASGQKQHEITYNRGVKIGTETHWNQDGRRNSEWKHGDGSGPKTWRQWWSNGQLKAESTWVNRHCHGRARTWHPDGTRKSDVEFVGGFPVAK